MTQTNPPQDLARTTLQLLALGALIVTSLWVVRPFLLPFLWASMIAVATWPLLLRAQAWLGGRRSLAVAGMTIALLLVLVVPVSFGVATVVEDATDVAGWSQSQAVLSVPPPPAWLDTVPLFGSRLAARWRELAAAAPEELVARIAPFARRFALWLAGLVGSAGLVVVEVLLTVVMSSILFFRGETAARAVEALARRLAGAQGVKATHLAAQAVRGVALGVVVTAILQSALVGIGLVVVGMPLAGILTALAFLLSIAQVGPALVLIAAVIWVYATQGSTWGTGFLVWAILCATIDNLFRPLLIRRGADLPLLLIFAGVIGGLISFGVIGLFIGPVVLAVAYMLIVEWVSQGENP